MQRKKRCVKIDLPAAAPPAVCGVVGPGPPRWLLFVCVFCMCTVCKRRGGRKRLLWTRFGGGYPGLQPLVVLGRT